MHVVLQDVKSGFHHSDSSQRGNKNRPISCSSLQLATIQYKKVGLEYGMLGELLRKLGTQLLCHLIMFVCFKVFFIKSLEACNVVLRPITCKHSPLIRIQKLKRIENEILWIQVKYNFISWSKVCFKLYSHCWVVNTLLGVTPC